MNKNDRTWAQLNAQQNKPLSLAPVGYVNKQNGLVRFVKAMILCATTKYSWATSWHQAAR